MTVDEDHGFCGRKKAVVYAMSLFNGERAFYPSTAPKFADR